MTHSSFLIPWLLLAGSCGGVSGGDDAGGVDGAADIDGPPIDAPAIDANLRPCDPAGPFGDVRQVAGLATADQEGNPSLSADELTIYFFSNRQRPGTADLDAYVATRPTRDAAFGPLCPITAINTTDDERGGSMSPNELALFFHSSISGQHDLYVSTRPNVAAPFGAPATLGAGVNTADHDQTPWVSADGQTLYFTRTPSAGGTSSIYRAAAGPTGFTGATLITELTASATSSLDPILSADGLTIYFSSDRPGGAGSLDVWVATRPSLTAPFAQITNVTELNSSAFEFLDWISPDGCRVYFTSGRSGTWDMWQASRPL